MRGRTKIRISLTQRAVRRPLGGEGDGGAAHDRRRPHFSTGHGMLAAAPRQARPTAADHVLQIEPGFTIRGLTRLAYSDEVEQRGPLPRRRKYVRRCIPRGRSGKGSNTSGLPPSRLTLRSIRLCCCDADIVRTTTHRVAPWPPSDPACRSLR
jgi:hypothetical protein